MCMHAIAIESFNAILRDHEWHGRQYWWPNHKIERNAKKKKKKLNVTSLLDRNALIVHIYSSCYTCFYFPSPFLSIIIPADAAATKTKTNTAAMYFMIYHKNVFFSFNLIKMIQTKNEHFEIYFFLFLLLFCLTKIRCNPMNATK